MNQNGEANNQSQSFEEGSAQNNQVAQQQQHQEQQLQSQPITTTPVAQQQQTVPTTSQLFPQSNITIDDYSPNYHDFVNQDQAAADQNIQFFQQLFANTKGDPNIAKPDQELVDKVLKNDDWDKFNTAYRKKHVDPDTLEDKGKQQDKINVFEEVVQLEMTHAQSQEEQARQFARVFTYLNDMEVAQKFTDNLKKTGDDTNQRLLNARWTKIEAEKQKAQQAQLDKKREEEAELPVRKLSFQRFFQQAGKINEVNPTADWHLELITKLKENADVQKIFTTLSWDNQEKKELECDVQHSRLQVLLVKFYEFLLFLKNKLDNLISLRSSTAGTPKKALTYLIDAFSEQLEEFFCVIDCSRLMHPANILQFLHESIRIQDSMSRIQRIWLQPEMISSFTQVVKFFKWKADIKEFLTIVSEFNGEISQSCSAQLRFVGYLQQQGMKKNMIQYPHLHEFLSCKESVEQFANFAKESAKYCITDAFFTNNSRFSQNKKMASFMHKNISTNKIGPERDVMQYWGSLSQLYSDAEKRDMEAMPRMEASKRIRQRLYTTDQVEQDYTATDFICLASIYQRDIFVYNQDGKFCQAYYACLPDNPELVFVPGKPSQEYKNYLQDPFFVIYFEAEKKYSVVTLSLLECRLKADRKVNDLRIFQADAKSQCIPATHMIQCLTPAVNQQLLLVVKNQLKPKYEVVPGRNFCAINKPTLNSEGIPEDYLKLVNVNYDSITSEPESIFVVPQTIEGILGQIKVALRRYKDKNPGKIIAGFNPTTSQFTNQVAQNNETLPESTLVVYDKIIACGLTRDTVQLFPDIPARQIPIFQIQYFTKSEDEHGQIIKTFWATIIDVQCTLSSRNHMFEYIKDNAPVEFSEYCLQYILEHEAALADADLNEDGFKRMDNLNISKDQYDEFMQRIPYYVYGPNKLFGDTCQTLFLKLQRYDKLMIPQLFTMITSNIITSALDEVTVVSKHEFRCELDRIPAYPKVQKKNEDIFIRQNRNLEAVEKKQFESFARTPLNKLSNMAYTNEQVFQNHLDKCNANWVVPKSETYYSSVVMCTNFLAGCSVYESVRDFIDTVSNLQNKSSPDPITGASFNDVHLENAEDDFIKSFGRTFALHDLKVVLPALYSNEQPDQAQCGCHLLQYSIIVENTQFHTPLKHSTNKELNDYFNYKVKTDRAVIELIYKKDVDIKTAAPEVSVIFFSYLCHQWLHYNPDTNEVGDITKIREGMNLCVNFKISVLKSVNGTFKQTVTSHQLALNDAKFSSFHKSRYLIDESVQKALYFSQFYKLPFSELALKGFYYNLQNHNDVFKMSPVDIEFLNNSPQESLDNKFLNTGGLNPSLDLDDLLPNNGGAVLGDDDDIDDVAQQILARDQSCDRINAGCLISANQDDNTDDYKFRYDSTYEEYTKNMKPEDFDSIADQYDKHKQTPHTKLQPSAKSADHTDVNTAVTAIKKFLQSKGVHVPLLKAMQLFIQQKFGTSIVDVILDEATMQFAYISEEFTTPLSWTRKQFDSRVVQILRWHNDEGLLLTEPQLLKYKEIQTFFNIVLNSDKGQELILSILTKLHLVGEKVTSDYQDWLHQQFWSLVRATQMSFNEESDQEPPPLRPSEMAIRAKMKKSYAGESGRDHSRSSNGPQANEPYSSGAARNPKNVQSFIDSFGNQHKLKGKKNLKQAEPNNGFLLTNMQTNAQKPTVPTYTQMNLRDNTKNQRTANSAWQQLVQNSKKRS